jgi:hypothetical protein
VETLLAWQVFKLSKSQLCAAVFPVDLYLSHTIKGANVY